MDTFFTAGKIESAQRNRSLNTFALWFALSFIFNGYASGIPGISLGSLIFIIMILITLVKCPALKNPSNVVLFTVSLILCSYIGMAANAADSIDIRGHLIFTAKLLLWMLMVSSVAWYYYQFDSIYKYIRIIGYVLIVYLVVQNIAFYILHIYLPNIFDLYILRPYAEDYASEALGMGRIIRPASLLSESSFLGSYLMCMLAMLFEQGSRSGKISLNEAMIVSFAIFLSSSTSAQLLLILIWLLNWNTLKGSKKSLIIIVFMFLMLLFLIAVNLVPMLMANEFTYSTQYSFDKLGRLEKMARFGKSYNYLEYLEPGEQLLGVGLGNDNRYLLARTGEDEIYLNSVTSMIVSSGYIGLLLFIGFILVLLYKAFKCKNRLAITLLLIYFIKGFAGGMYFSTYGVMYMFIIFGELMTHPKES